MEREFNELGIIPEKSFCLFICFGSFLCVCVWDKGVQVSWRVIAHLGDPHFCWGEQMKEPWAGDMR